MGRTAKPNKLTDFAVRAYVAGTSADAGKGFLGDGAGLFLRRRATGCFWYMKATSPETGATQWHSLFERPFPAQSLAQARVAAEALRKVYASRIDPRAEAERRQVAQRLADERAKQELQALTRRVSIRSLFDQWCKVDLQPHLRADGKRAGRKDGGAYTREQFERRVFPELGDIAAADVGKADLMAILDSAKAEGKLRTCNVLLAHLKQMFAFALAREIVDRNPLADVERRHVGGSEVQRDRILSLDELKSLAARVPSSRLNARSAAAVWLLLGTMARISELMGAVWKDDAIDLASLQELADSSEVKLGVVDLKAGTWHLFDTKNQRDHTIHLSKFSAALFESLAALRVRDEDGARVPWVFPDSTAKGPVCVKSFGKQLADRQRPADARMSNRSKATESLALPGGKWTAHDLRRTAASLMADLGISGDVIDECLNHVIESRVRRTYIRNRRPKEQARAFDSLGARLQTLSEGLGVASNVVDLNRVKAGAHA